MSKRKRTPEDDTTLALPGGGEQATTAEERAGDEANRLIEQAGNPSPPTEPPTDKPAAKPRTMSTYTVTGIAIDSGLLEVLVTCPTSGRVRKWLDMVGPFVSRSHRDLRILKTRDATEAFLGPVEEAPAPAATEAI